MPEGMADPPASSEEVDDTSRRRLLFFVVGIGGGLLLFYVLFGTVLMGLLPSPDGGKQGLRLIGTVVYTGGAFLVLAGMVLLVLRLLRSGVEPDELPSRLIRPGFGALVILGFSGLVLLLIHRTTPLPIDILEPRNTQGLTAPVSVTFGTDSLRRILKNQGLFPRRYSWDFNGDRKSDAEKQDHEVTTVYRRKGIYLISVQILLSDGSMRTASTRMIIPHALFSVNPPIPIIDENVEFDVTDLIMDPEAVDRILWDFNGDGQDDEEGKGKEFIKTHRYGEVGTYQARVIIQNTSGVQETYIRPITVLEEREQPFAIHIESDGVLKGSAPLGILFRAVIEEGIRVRDMRWTIGKAETVGRMKEEALSGERIAQTFTEAGEYSVTLMVSDVTGRIARTSKAVSVLEPLIIKDLFVTGRPKPEHNRVEGTAPLEVHLSAVTNTPFITFRWEQENATKVFSSEKDYHALYEEPGTFPVLLIAKDAQERMQKIPLEVNVLPPKSRVAFTAIPSTGIAPLTVTFDASSSFVPDGRITGFSWTFGDMGKEEKPQLLGAQITHRYENEGTYIVIVRALTEEGQSYEARKTVVVRSPTLDACVFPSRTVGNAPMGVRFDAHCSTGNIVKYLWDFGDGATSEEKTPTQDHVFSVPGTYAVKLEVSDGQGNFSTFNLTITVH